MSDLTAALERLLEKPLTPDRLFKASAYHGPLVEHCLALAEHDRHDSRCSALLVDCSTNDCDCGLVDRTRAALLAALEGE